MKFSPIASIRDRLEKMSYDANRKIQTKMYEIAKGAGNEEACLGALDNLNDQFGLYKS